MKNIYTRWQQKLIQRAMETRRVVFLCGARQCGKTTLSKEFVSKDAIYRTLDDLTLLEAAKNDPQGFIKHDAQVLIIDEVQHVPTLLLAIKKVVDEDNRVGQYLLTGSSNIQSLPNVRESLAGRIRKIRLHPLTQGEILGKEPHFLESSFNQSFENFQTPCDSEDILEIAFQGGFPEIIRLGQKESKQWHRDYISSLLERDLRDITHIRRYDAMQNLVTTLAAWSGKFMDISAISASLSVQRPTVESYINALEALYLVERVRSWTKTDYDRIGKQDKLFMTDCGLMSSILGWKLENIRFDSDRKGKLIETFAFNEILAQVDINQDEYDLFHYRDREKREIDFIVERSDGALLGVEIKSGSVVDNRNFKHLRWFEKNITRNKPFVGIVLYTGRNVVSFGPNMWAVPINFLWN